MIIYPQPLIDWPLLAKAVSFYLNAKFKQVETPFAIPCFYHYYTKPHNDQSFVLDDGAFKDNPHELVGSAEQGFIYLLLNDHITSSQRLFSVTPCFRYDNYDTLHQPWFMKLELFHYSSSTEDLHSMIEMVKQFYQEQCVCNAQIIQTGLDSYDLEINNIEVGSFGFRTVENNTFIYGTGLALPRFSIANTQGN